MSYRPLLRSDLVQQGPDPEAPVALYDPVLDRRIGLGELGRTMVPLLDGRHAVNDVIAQVQAAHTERERAEVEATLRSMLLLLCVQGTGRDVLQQARNIRFDGATLELDYLEETRVQCQGSGACCQMYSLGPLTDADVERLDSLDIAGKLPAAGGGPYVREVEGVAGRFLQSVDGRCVFLTPDRRCGLHATFGADSKPVACRIFPLTVRPTIRGHRVYDNGECSSFVESASSGRLVRESLSSLTPLLPAGYIEHPIAFVDERTPCDYSYVLDLSDALVTLTERAPDVATAIGRAAHLAGRWATALARSPLLPGAAESAAAAALRDVDSDHEIVADAVDSAALTRVARAILEQAEPAARARAEKEPRRLATAVAGGFVEAMALLRDNAFDLGVAADEPWVAEALRRSLRQRFHGGLLLQDGHVRSGLAAAGLLVLLALTGARRRAQSQGRTRITREDLSLGHSMAAVGLREPAVQAAIVAHDRYGAAIARAVSSLLTGTV